MKEDLVKIPNDSKIKKLRDIDFKIVFNDDENIISDKFKVPNSLYDKVLFWSKIYAQYPSTSIVIHDREHLSIVYKVLDYSKLWDSKKISKYKKLYKMRSNIYFEISNIKNKLNQLAKFKNKSTLNSDLTLINKLRNLYKIKDTHTLVKTAIKNIRTQTGQKDFFISGIKRSGKYMEKIDKIFFENNLPIELSKLPFLESSYNFKAISKVGATGLWQIMDSTGEYYLKLNKYIDERISPIKASIAASKILKQDYRILKSWPLAVTAYNFGAYRLKKASKKFNTKDLAVIIDKYENPYFGFAAKNFYAGFLAALYVYTYHELFFGKITKNLISPCESIILEKDLYLKQISNIVDLSVEEIKMYNPDLKKNVLQSKIPIKKGYEIRIPKNLIIKLLAYFVKDLDMEKLKEKE